MKILKAIALIFLVVWAFPVHFMSYLETRPVAIPDANFGDEVPDDYYACDCPIDYLRLGGNAERWLDGLRWNRPYVPNEWDCSTQAAFVEWALECCGTETDILVGTSHAWVKAKIDGRWRQYEPTFGAFLSPGMESLIVQYWPFCDLHHLRLFFENRWEKYPHRWLDPRPSETFDEWFASEWFWWKIERGGE